MAEKQELEITIEPDGNVVVNVQGAHGKRCMEITAELESALGVVTERERKPSFFEETLTERELEIKGGI